MAVNVDSSFVASFDAMVKHAYQDEMKLRGTVRLKTGVVGKTHRFPLIGEAMAEKRVPRTLVQPGKTKHDGKVATLEDYITTEFSDVYDLAKLNFDEKKELATACAKSMGRRSDQLQIDAMAADSTIGSVATNFGGDNSFNLKKLLRMKRIMDENNVPEYDRHLAIPAVMLEEALNSDKFTSEDYNLVRTLYDGTLKKYAGFEFHLIGNRTEGGLGSSKSGSTVTYNAYGWHKDAVGFAIGMDIRTDITYENLYTSWLINCLFSAGAVVIDPKGVVKMTTQETTS